jgi:hypothetical protein
MSTISAVTRKAWRRVQEARRFGAFRTRERYGLISRPNYVYGMLRAADVARYFGKKRITAVEFGVASGGGLLNMISLAPLIEKETGIAFETVGFDTGAGLPPFEGYKNHPELWNPGDFAMEERDVLMRKLDGRAKMIWGDIAETVGPFTEALGGDAPLGFISVDVDIYSGAKSALRCLEGAVEKYLPAISMYFDDVGFFFANQWSGELLAIREFNEEHKMRKIDRDHSLPGRRSPKGWHSLMYVCHMLDHEGRQKPRDRSQLTIGAHWEFIEGALS